ncbi:MAG TPA: tetratricopeptide repeat protein [Caulobacteraceae bacterium]
MASGRPLLAALAAGLLCIGAAQALAQTPLDNDPLDDHSAKRLDRMEKVVRELRSIVFQARDTGQPVTVQPADTATQLNGLSDRVNDLERTLARLTGELEVTRHDLDLSRQDAVAERSENTAIKERLSALEQKIAALSAGPVAAAPPALDEQPPGPPADPAQAFAAARHALEAGDFPSAETGFRDYVDRFGDSPRGPLARYYLAKALIGRHAWAEAATADIDAIRGWPQTTWAPDAVLDLARSLTEMKKPADACQTLDELARRYPKASAEVKSGAADGRTRAQCA